MKYMGSKARIAKEIIPIIMKDYEYGMHFVDLFAGGMNLIDKIAVDNLHKIANDKNKYLIEMFKALQQGWIPKNHYSKEEYDFAKNNMNIDPKTTGYIGFNCSYSGKWFGGYAGIVNTKQGVRNYQDEALRNVLKQVDSLKNVEFINIDYRDFIPYTKSIIYCDIPYKGTTQYKDKFDHDKFYEWCLNMKNKGHSIFVSEYDMPNEFKCVWQKDVRSSLSANGIIGGSKKSTEKLYTL